jgi:hypothetical protein
MDPSSSLPPICRKPPYRSVTVAAQPVESPRVYHVPRRFGLLAVMTFLTAFSLLFAVLRVMEHPPGTYLGLGTFGVVIAGLQMSFGKVPRVASISAGALLLPLTILGVALLNSGWIAVLHFLPGFPFMVAFGGLFGYLVGTLVAGLFLVLDYWERRMFPGMTPKGRSPEASG